MLATEHVCVLPPPGNVEEEFKRQTRHRADLVALAILSHLGFEPRHVAHALPRLDSLDVLRRIVRTQFHFLTELHQSPERLDPVFLRVRLHRLKHVGEMMRPDSCEPFLAVLVTPLLQDRTAHILRRSGKLDLEILTLVIRNDSGVERSGFGAALADCGRRLRTPSALPDRPP